MRLLSSILFICMCLGGLSQNWSVSKVGRLPFAVANNAVTLAYSDGEACIYTFCGIDSTLKSSGIHLKSAGFNLSTGQSFSLIDAPDTMGKVAAAASTVNNKIYVIGGYHVYADGGEKSSNLVHRFDPETNEWLSNGKNIPVAIDDHIQAVWNDSLIYVITGWSDSKNVPNVQIYDPETDEWSVGTGVPDNNRYKAFGASGTIIGNTIYYLGGASMLNNFPSTFFLRIGKINPIHPQEITWRDSLLSPSDKFYRAVSVNLGGHPAWLGGSETTYNYNGRAYITGAIVSPANKSLLLYKDEILRTETSAIPMDLRGAAEWSTTIKYLAGGIYDDLNVTDDVIQLSWGYPASVDLFNQKNQLPYPIPCNDKLHLGRETSFKVRNTFGKVLLQGEHKMVNTSELPNGIYFLSYEEKTVRFVVSH